MKYDKTSANQVCCKKAKLDKLDACEKIRDIIRITAIQYVKNKEK